LLVCRLRGICQGDEPHLYLPLLDPRRIGWKATREQVRVGLVACFPVRP